MAEARMKTSQTLGTEAGAKIQALRGALHSYRPIYDSCLEKLLNLPKGRIFDYQDVRAKGQTYTSLVLREALRCGVIEYVESVHHGIGLIRKYRKLV